jgi:hypothetical protein
MSKYSKDQVYLFNVQNEEELLAVQKWGQWKGLIIQDRISWGEFKVALIFEGGASYHNPSTSSYSEGIWLDVAKVIGEYTEWLGTVKPVEAEVPEDIIPQTISAMINNKEVIFKRVD